MLGLYERVKGRYDWSLGSHIEMDSRGELYAVGCRYQPDEARLEQAPAVLDELVATLQGPSFHTRNYALTPTAK